jgi:hypothetical protein
MMSGQSAKGRSLNTGYGPTSRGAGFAKMADAT